MKYLVLTSIFLISFAASASPLIIIGKDTRVEITDSTARSIHNSIGLLLISFGKDQGSCTGTIVGPKTVITAAHCLYKDKTKAMASEVIFVPGLRSKLGLKDFPYGSFKSSKVRILSKFKENLSDSYDLGLVTFDENLPFEAVALSHSFRGDKNITIAGYPGDKKLGELWEGNGVRSEAFMIKLLTRYDVDTYKGQSGSAIRTLRTDGSEAIIGIHSGKYNEGSNVGFFFTRQTLDLVKTWIQEDK